MWKLNFEISADENNKEWKFYEPFKRIFSDGVIEMNVFLKQHFCVFFTTLYQVCRNNKSLS
ncbi:hypothetical protein C1N32_07060 [Vibrio diazotrophicus]|uniref:Uncharacterized protein n=1 Tax=Vibrio diazotrophicus TaxID=685 RepID=A0A2J8I5P6_VIBDI|nr:hypothetical protein C1M59_05735 [Vibrio diazotrophicus]PNI05845.1 hypothetical protein C1N32_07060 [Vibrio diazotrophicus]